MTSLPATVDEMIPAFREFVQHSMLAFREFVQHSMLAFCEFVAWSRLPHPLRCYFYHKATHLPFPFSCVGFYQLRRKTTNTDKHSAPSSPGECETSHGRYEAGDTGAFVCSQRWTEPGHATCE